jgi:hypothetical protein
MLGSMRVLAATVALSSLGLLVSAWAGAVPKPPPKFWSVSRCERVLARDYGFPTAEGHRFHVDHAVCVGTGGPHACKWTSDHRSRLYSEFRVFGRSRYIGSIVRSWTLATRRGHGLVGIQHPAGGQVRGPRGGPPDFYVSPVSVRLLATSSTPASFRSIVAPIAARVAQQENATRCTGPG